MKGYRISLHFFLLSHHHRAHQTADGKGKTSTLLDAEKGIQSYC